MPTIETQNERVFRRPSRRSLGGLAAAVAAALSLLGTSAHAGLFSRNPSDHWQTLPNGDVMHYTELGSSSGKTLLFVHGWPTSARLWEPVVKEICGGWRPAYRCIAVSQIGFGKSSCPGDGSSVDPSYEVDRLDEFIDAMGLDDFALVVHDWGGPVGTAAALRHADRMTHLVVLNTFMEAGQPGENDLLLAAMDAVGGYFEEDRPILSLFPLFVSGVMQAFTSKWLFYGTRDDYKDPYQGGAVAECRVHAGLNLFGKANTPESLAVYEEIAGGLVTAWNGRPARFLWAVDDPVLGPFAKLGDEAHSYMAALLPQADTKLIFGASHFMQEDQPRAVASEIVSFVR